MDRPPSLAAVSIALIRGECVLLVRRGRAPAKGLFAFPGGRVEGDETLEEAVRRELREETGLEAGRIGLVVTLDIAPEGSGPGFLLHVFRGVHVGGEPQPGDDADLADFYSLEEMQHLPMIPSVTEVARQLLGGMPSDDANHAADKRR